MNELVAQKRAMREAGLKVRAAIPETGRDAAAVLAAQLFLRHIPAAAEVAGMVVSGWWPMPGEMDPRPLLLELAAQGATTALPVVTGRNHDLAFRAWDFTRADVPPHGTHAIPAPDESAPLVVPDLVLAPFLAVDRAGWRLGYGGGYFDRTLRALRAAGTVLAVGLGFAAQEVAAVPHDEFDARLDWVVTEQAAWHTDQAWKAER